VSLPLTMQSIAVAGLLAEPDRLRAYAAIVLGAHRTDEIADRAGLPVAVAQKAVRRLEAGGLVTSGPDGVQVVEGAFKDAVRADQPEEPAPLDDDPRRNAVLKSFIKNGRLALMPTHPAKLRIVLEHLAKSFEPERSYPEQEVNEILTAWHDDYATLRRYLVDAGLLTRENAIYQRGI
jgi:hypothetical protein